MEVIIESPTAQVFQGVRYYRCGRYFQRKGKRLHRVVWETLNGPIPKGWHVHHVDHDPTNNQPRNLALVPKAEHLMHHANTPEAIEAAKARWKKHVQPKAKAWHKSPEGRAWHREHGRRVAASITPRLVTCETCGRSFETTCMRKTVRFCSDMCGERSRARRSGTAATGKKAEQLRKAWGSRRLKASDAQAEPMSTTSK